ncbi:hypothetical protein C9374_014095 [Naegleria lovaniensis]|uniref:Uncharacterized protein n=1 Tax=Naegleria lovaniensis TaxID=51637 RepID=A0AA88GYS3_NAELO|nr:uncharacterized protein C9374_014095 [Naegleria lovaniensis]KAG2389535.1 hypothetical protein C9374_014095 [Naegleria lovaniensis]
MSSPTGSLSPSSAQPITPLKLTPFLKTFLTLMYWEPFIYEMFFGMILMLFPNVRFVLGSFMPQHLVEVLMSGGGITTPSTTSTLYTNIELRQWIFFFIRSLGMSLFAFGCIHHLLLRHCYKEMAHSNSSYLIEKVSLFHKTIFALCVGDLLYIGLVWKYMFSDTLPNNLLLVGADVLGIRDFLFPILPVLFPTALTLIVLLLRVVFLLNYSSWKILGMGWDQGQQHLRRIHVE